MTNTIYTSEKVMPYVYIGTHKTTGQFYIGYRCANKVSSSRDLGNRYKTSSKRVKEEGFENFNWIILAEFFTKQAALDFEQVLIEEHITNPLNINFFVGTKWTTLGHRHSEETKHKMRKQKSTTINMSIAQYNRTEEHQNNLNKANIGKKASDETRKKLSLASLGKPKSDRHKQNMKNKIVTDDHKRHISESLKGKLKSESHKLNLRKLTEEQEVYVCQLKEQGFQIEEIKKLVIEKWSISISSSYIGKVHMKHRANKESRANIPKLSIEQELIVVQLKVEKWSAKDIQKFIKENWNISTSGSLISHIWRRYNPAPSRYSKLSEEQELLLVKMKQEGEISRSVKEFFQNTFNINISCSLVDKIYRRYCPK